MYSFRKTSPRQTSVRFVKTNMEDATTKPVKENTMENTERRKRSCVKEEDEEEPCSKRVVPPPPQLIEIEEETDVEPGTFSDHAYTRTSTGTSTEPPTMTSTPVTVKVEQCDESLHGARQTEAPTPAVTSSATSALPASKKTSVPVAFSPQTVKCAVSWLSAKNTQTDVPKPASTLKPPPVTSSITQTEVPKPAVTSSATSAFPALKKTSVPVTFSPQTVKCAIGRLSARDTQTDVPKPSSTSKAPPKTSVPVAFSLGTVKHAVDGLAFTSTVTMTATTVTTSWSDVSTSSMSQLPLIAPESRGTWSDGSTETSLRPPIVTSTPVFCLFSSGKVKRYMLGARETQPEVPKTALTSSAEPRVQGPKKTSVPVAFSSETVKCAVSSLSSRDTRTDVPNPASTLKAPPMTSVPVVLSPLIVKHIVDRLAVKTAEASRTDLTTSVIPPPAELSTRPKRSTRVVVEYGTSQKSRILKGKWEAVARSLSQGRFKAIPRNLMEIPGMREVVVKEVMKLVNKECNNLSSFKFNSIMRKTSPAALKAFKWVNLINEWKATAPTFLSFLEATSNSSSNQSKRRSMAMAGANLLKARCDHMCAPMFRNSMILWHGGAEKRCVNMMSRLGVCVSLTATLSKLKSIEQDFDSSFLQGISKLSEAADSTTAEGSMDPHPGSTNERQHDASQLGAGDTQSEVTKLP